MIKSYKTILFDFDGVLVDTHDLHYTAMTEYFNVDMDMQQFKDMHDGNFFSREHPEVLQGADWSNYSEYITEIVKARVIVPSDRAETVRRLSQQYPLFVITSGVEVGIKHLLKEADILSCFSKVMGYETSTSKVEKIRMAMEETGCEPGQSVFVTDTLGDILEGQEAGVGKIIAVTYGYHTRDHLEQGNPHKFVDSFAELLVAIDEA